MNTSQSATEIRRLKLRVAAKLMMLMAFLAIIYVFVAALWSGNRHQPAVPSMKVEIGHVQAGEATFLTWEGRPVVIYRRTSDDINALKEADGRLLDPASKKSEQPVGAENALRSINAEWFVAIALGTDLGCSLEYLAQTRAEFQEKLWQGGFVDTCRKARYDLAGRVYRSQYATRNLVVPDYAFEGKTLVLGRK